jgi:hypothetical protein
VSYNAQMDTDDGARGPAKICRGWERAGRVPSAFGFRAGDVPVAISPSGPRLRATLAVVVVVLSETRKPLRGREHGSGQAGPVPS